MPLTVINTVSFDSFANKDDGRSIIIKMLFLMLVVAMFLSLPIQANTQLTVSTVSIENCPLYKRIVSIPDGDGSISFNYTQDVISNPEYYWCDSVPNMIYKENDRVEGAVNSFNRHTAILELNNGYYCNYTNGNQELYERVMNSFKLFSNETLVKMFLITYLEGLLVEKNYTNTMRYYFYFFDTRVEMQDVSITLIDWINYFNYFLFCKENNPYFNEFRQVSLPYIVQFSKYEKVQTLDVLFGRNVAQYCGKKELTINNRTLLCLCSDSSNSNDSIVFRSLMGSECGGSMERFWVPLSSHLSLKVIEIVFHLIQSIALPLLCLFPILFRNGIKWRDHMKSRNTMASIEKGKKQQATFTPRPQEISEKVKADTISNNELPTEPSQVKLDTITPVQSDSHHSQACNKNEPNRNSMKEQLSHELVRVLCDLKLLAGVSLEFSILCLLGSSIQHAAEPKGTAQYPNPTLLIASLAFLCVSNIPLAGLFVEVLLKLSGNNKKVSIHGL